MKCTIPEISWHNRDPVLSIDVQFSKNGVPPFRLATGGTDSHVVIWHLTVNENGLASVEVAADLQRHQKAVNTVRFSPSGQYLASGDDEAVIIVWKPKTEHDISELSIDNEVNKEQWVSLKFLRGHLEDVYDISWSSDSSHLISGSIDNTAILWDIQKGRNLGILSGHGGFVQGVAWDPKNKFVATLSSDRTCRIHNISTKKLAAKVYKTTLPVPPTSEMEGKVVRLFHDDTLKSFFRRLSFSPDGQLLVAPSGIIEIPDSEKHINATYIFTRYDFSRPVVYLPSPREYTVAVRFCPLLFKLHEGASLFALPYRMVFAVATKSNVILYDTQQPEPIVFISNIHYTRLTDLSWSGDGKLLIASSTDGYCSIVTFAGNELGEEYIPPTGSNTENGDIKNSENKHSQKTTPAEAPEANAQEILVTDKSKKSDCEEQAENRNNKVAKDIQSRGQNVPCADLTDSDSLKSNKNLETDCKMDVDMENTLTKHNKKSPKNSTEAHEQTNDKKLLSTLTSQTSDEPMLLDITTVNSSSETDTRILENAKEGEQVKENLKSSKLLAETGSSLDETNDESMDIEIIEIKTKPTAFKRDIPDTMKDDNDSSLKSPLSKTTSDEGPNTFENKITPAEVADGSSGKNPIEESTNENEKSPPKKSETKHFCETTPSKYLSNRSSTPLRETSHTTNSNVETSLQPSTAHNVTPVANRTPRRVQLITLSSPKSKKKLL